MPYKIKRDREKKTNKIKEKYIHIERRNKKKHANEHSSCALESDSQQPKAGTRKIAMQISIGERGKSL